LRDPAKSMVPSAGSRPAAPAISQTSKELINSCSNLQPLTRTASYLGASLLSSKHSNRSATHQLNHPPRSNPHSAPHRRTLSSAVSSLGGFRTPAARACGKHSPAAGIRKPSHNRTHAPQRASLFDHLVGGRDKIGGSASPRAWAVRRLTTKSNCEVALIGRSPGLAPRRIRST
jgi:hypothetical protein